MRTKTFLVSKLVSKFVFNILTTAKVMKLGHGLETHPTDWEERG